MSAKLAEKRATVKFGAKAAVFVFGRRGLPQTVSAVIQSHGRVLQATHGGAIFWCKDTTAQIMRATSRSRFALALGPEGMLAAQGQQAESEETALCLLYGVLWLLRRVRGGRTKGRLAPAKSGTCSAYALAPCSAPLVLSLRG